jgi:hypothetical protein
MDGGGGEEQRDLKKKKTEVHAHIISFKNYEYVA